MKTIIIFITIVAFTACNSKPAVTVTTNVPTSDTTGLSEFRQYKAQNLQSVQNQYQQPQRTTQVYREEPKSFGGHTRSTSSHTYHTTASSPAYSSTSESSNTAYRRKGMSKGAKDAIIGGVGGAVIGAVADKNNRGVGALIGGVVGGGAGYAIGHSKDKKKVVIKN